MRLNVLSPSDGRRRLIRAGLSEPRLYDLRHDTAEEYDLAVSDPETARGLLAKCETWLKLDSSANIGSKTMHRDEEGSRAMESLGYPGDEDR